MDDRTLFDEVGLLVVADTINKTFFGPGEAIDHPVSENLKKFLSRKCESEKYFTWGIYEELCRASNEIVRSMGVEFDLFNGDVPRVPLPNFGGEDRLFTVNRFCRNVLKGEDSDNPVISAAHALSDRYDKESFPS